MSGKGYYRITHTARPFGKEITRQFDLYAHGPEDARKSARSLGMRVKSVRKIAKKNAKPGFVAANRERRRRAK